MESAIVESLEEGMMFSQFSKMFLFCMWHTVQRNIYACQTLAIAFSMVIKHKYISAFCMKLIKKKTITKYVPEVLFKTACVKLSGVWQFGQGLSCIVVGFFCNTE
jgi:hypothetical protein